MIRLPLTKVPGKFFETKHPSNSGPTAKGYLRLAERQLQVRAIAATGLAIFVGATIVSAMDLSLPALPFAALIALLFPILVWRYPCAALYVAVGGGCLVEQLVTKQPDAITDRIPLYWNFNTICDVYFGMNIKSVPFNLFEMILIAAALCSLFRAVFSGTVRIRLGPTFWPIVAYLFFVLVAFGNGMTSGGDFKIALQETRAQVYFLAVYLMAVNLINSRRQVSTVVWIVAVTVAIKGLLYTFRRYVTLQGLPVPDQGVGSHEEAFFFDVFVCLLIAILICGTRPKLQRFMLWALPLVELGNLATNRRAGTAAMAILVPVVFLAAYQGFPGRRKAVVIIGLSGLILGAAYYSAFKNSTSSIGQPARAIHSQFQPDARDASSNAYRDAENADQMATIRMAPLGYGYGKHFLHAVPIDDISTEYAWWDMLPHNNILWVWMRTGSLGFFAFWIMIASLIIYNAMCFRDDTLSLEYRSVGLFALMVVGCQLVFGLLDLQLVNFRDMTMTGIACGLVVSVRRLGTVERGSVGTESVIEREKT